MDFEQFYAKFEEEAKKLLGDGLWEKGAAASCPKEFAKELFDSDAFDDPSDAAEEYAEMVQEMDKEGAFGESKCEGEDAPCSAWAVEYKDIWDEQTVERFEDEKEAWARYNELKSRTVGDMSDIMWVKEPKCLAEECGSSASSLGAVPTGGTEKDEAGSKDVEEFLSNALDSAVIEDIDSGEEYNIKFIADAGEFELIALGPDGKRWTLKSGPLFSVVDYYRELVEMDREDAVFLIKSEAPKVTEEE